MDPKLSLAVPSDAQVARFRDDIARLIDVHRDTLLVAVSGGGDSIALLLLARALLGDRCLAATVDHALRTESADEAEFVAALCAARGIAHTILTGALPTRSGGSANMSARARALRYRLLEGHAQATGAAWIATAHHADDQLETLVMRLNRGAGVGGLAGIRRTSGRAVRPLLGWRRAELAGIVANCGVAAVSDPSNVDDRYDRARLRKMLAAVDWLDTDRIATSAQALGDADDALAWTMRRLWRERGEAAAGRLTLDPGDLPDELVRRLVLHCLGVIDPDHVPTGPGLTRLIATLERGNPAMSGNVLVTVTGWGSAARRWSFQPAPPRRATLSRSH